MKKIAKLSGDIRIVGNAEKDGVIFQAEKIAGPYRDSPLGTLATVKEDSSILCNTWDEKGPLSNTQAKLNKYIRSTFIVTCILCLFFIIVYAALYHMANTKIMVFFDLGYIMLSAMYLRKPIGIFIARLLGDKDVISFSKFLAAQNAVQNAYYDLGRVPNITQAKNYSTFSYYNKYFEPITVTQGTLWLTIPLTQPIKSDCWILIFLALVVTIFILGLKNRLYFWQFLTVSNPEDIHFEAAITALERAVNCVKFLELSSEQGTKTQFWYLLHFDEKKCEGCPHYSHCMECYKSILKKDSVE